MGKKEIKKATRGSIEENKHLVEKDLEASLDPSTRRFNAKRLRKTLFVSGGLTLLGLTATLGYLGQTDVSNGFSEEDTGKTEIDSEDSNEFFYEDFDVDGDGQISMVDVETFIDAQDFDEAEKNELKYCVKTNWNHYHEFINDDATNEIDELKNKVLECNKNVVALETYAYTYDDENEAVKLMETSEQARAEAFDQVDEGQGLDQDSVLEAIGSLVSNDQYFQAHKCVEELYHEEKSPMDQEAFSKFVTKVAACMISDPTPGNIKTEDYAQEIEEFLSMTEEQAQDLLSELPEDDVTQSLFLQEVLPGHVGNIFGHYMTKWISELWYTNTLTKDEIIYDLLPKLKECAMSENGICPH